MKPVAYHLLTLTGLLLTMPAWGQEKLKYEDSYFPLKQGTSWVHTVDGKEFTTKVAGYEKSGDEVCARLETRRGEDLVASELVVVRKEEDGKEQGVYRVAFAGKSVTPAVRFLKLPVEKGKPEEKWDVDSKIGDESIKGKFRQSEEKGLTVGEKSYPNVVKIVSEGFTLPGTGTNPAQTLTITYYFAENVGMVKQIVQIGGTKVEADLKEFKEGK